MLEVRRRLDLGQETLAADDGCKLRLEDLERDAAVVSDVVSAARSSCRRAPAAAPRRSGCEEQSPDRRRSCATAARVQGALESRASELLLDSPAVETTLPRTFWVTRWSFALDSH